LLQARTGLNVNFPDVPEKAEWKLTRIGSYMKYELKFVADLPSAVEKGEEERQPPLPGLFARVSDQAPSASEANDEGVVAMTGIAVSVMQVGYDAPAKQQADIANVLSGFAR
jgi:broad specificity polyphosphatase/5'/3'-nucleotidase SurE